MDLAAVKIAMDLVHMPSRVRQVRAAPLPPGILPLLQIAVGEDQPLAEAVHLSGRPPDALHEAVSFFIEQILFCPDSDSYRALGLSPEATAVELRRNMALLLRWVNGESQAGSDRSVFLGHLTLAWNDLKTPERRSDYDRKRQQAIANKPAPRGRNPFNKGASGKGSSSKGRLGNGAAARTTRRRASGPGQWQRLYPHQESPHGGPPGFWRRLLMMLFGVRIDRRR